MSGPSNPPMGQWTSRASSATNDPAFFTLDTPTSVPPDLPPAYLDHYSPLSISVPGFDLPLHYTGNPTLRTTPRGTKRKLSDPDSSHDHEGYGPTGSFSSPSRSAASQWGFDLYRDQEAATRSTDGGGHHQQNGITGFVLRSIDNATHDLTVQQAMDRLGLQDAKGLLPGMAIRLLPHQLIGVGWMISQERQSEHKAGILADDMGLGKTVQMIATMVVNRPTDEDDSRTTLIVVPAALVSQWKDKLDTKTNGVFDVHIHHNKTKILDPDLLARKDVIITTYQTLNLDFHTPKGLNEEEDDWNEFDAYIAKVQLADAPLAGARAQEVLKPIMLRRTKNAIIEGKPILQLPPKDVETVFVDFSEDERQMG
ncbi:SNF2 family N-terminal domain-containing protein [Trametes meyenii]|nr:SNF2 family N-terminal domain-containing protein [Trametes meyenii]